MKYTIRNDTNSLREMCQCIWYDMQIMHHCPIIVFQLLLIYIIFHCFYHSAVISCIEFDQSIFIAMRYRVYISINDLTVSSVISLKTNCFEGMSERLMGTALHNGDVFHYIAARFVIICQEVAENRSTISVKTCVIS